MGSEREELYYERFQLYKKSSLRSLGFRLLVDKMRFRGLLVGESSDRRRNESRAFGGHRS